MARRKHIGHSKHGQTPTWATLCERFESYVDRVDGELGCWIWNGAGVKKGDYGKFNFWGRPMQAHRASWQLYISDIPNNDLTCHKCDVRQCVNPAHLFLCWFFQNSADMVAKNRGRWSKSREMPAPHWTAEDYERWLDKQDFRTEPTGAFGRINRMAMFFGGLQVDRGHELLDVVADNVKLLRGVHSSDRMRERAHKGLDIVMRRARPRTRSLYGLVFLETLDDEPLVAVDFDTTEEINRFIERTQRLYGLQKQLAQESNWGYAESASSFWDWLQTKDFNERIEDVIDFLETWTNWHLALNVLQDDGTRADALLFSPLRSEIHAVPYGRLYDTVELAQRIKNPLSEADLERVRGALSLS